MSKAHKPLTPPEPARDFRREELELANRKSQAWEDMLAGRISTRQAQRAFYVIHRQLRAVQTERKTAERRAAGREP